MQATYRVEGMTCGGCVRAVTNALEGAKATAVTVDLEAGTATVHGLGEAAVKQVIEDAGFEFGGQL
ncbi:MAG: heavy-metal-associated domain-containing protein [Myxococcales bacterium]|nr:heavy-metal-associated domain-containing protein [Myxococcales bacterium]